MKWRLTGRAVFRANRGLRGGLAIVVVLLFSGPSRGQQQAIPLNTGPRPVPAPVVFVAPPMVTGTAMDFLAEQLAGEIQDRNMTGVVVVGLSGPDRKITELGTRLRGGLSGSLARQVTGVNVPDGAAIRSFLKANRIAEDMVYSNALGGWIAQHMHADGYVTARINKTFGSAPTILAELFVCKTGVCEDSATFKATLKLTPEEFEDAGRDYVPTLKIPVVPAGIDGVSRPKCLVCPAPAVPQELRIENLQGSSHLLVTVLPDGTADDVYVVGPLGHGLDALAADAVLTWEFSPARDAKDVAVATQTEIDIPFKIEGVPVKKVKKK